MTDLSYLFQYATSYILFFVLLIIGKKIGGNRLFDKRGFTESKNFLIYLHLAGIVLFGVVPIYNSGTPAVFLPIPKPLDFGILFLIIILTVFLSIRLSRKEYDFWEGHRIFQKKISTSYIVFYFFFRTLFIVSYEIWFRGFLLSETAISIGKVNAVILNVFLYTLLHAVNGKKEMVGCIPFGILLCSLCLWQGSCWPAILIHLALTLSFEITIVRLVDKNQTLHEGFNNRGFGIHRA